MLDIDNLSLLQLQELQKEVSKKIKLKKLSFWGEIEQLRKYEEEKATKNTHVFKENSNSITKIKSLGFSICLYDDVHIGFLDFKKDKKDEQYYGLDYSLEDGLTKKRDDVTDEDFNNIKKIIEGK